MNAIARTESGSAQLLRLANLESMRMQRESGELPPLPEEARKEVPMSDIDPQEFGRLQAQVEQLIKCNETNTETLSIMSAALQSMQLQMAEAKGGWRMLMVLGGISASFGSAATWAISHFFGKGP